jgi:hypothetical protein
LERRGRGAAGLLACAFLAFPTGALAVETDVQLWPSVTLNHALTERWALHFQTRVRVDDDVSQAKDVLLRPFVSWSPLESLTLDLGYDYLHSFESSSENRIWQAAEYRLGWRDFTVENRLRLDERFVEGVSGVVVRLRYRLRGTHPIAGSWYAALSDEVLANLNGRGAGPVYGFEQNRLRFAVGARFFERLRVESGYEFQIVESRSSGTSIDNVFLVEFSIDTGKGLPRPFSPR